VRDGRENGTRTRSAAIHQPSLISSLPSSLSSPPLPNPLLLLVLNVYFLNRLHRW
jgi:hypothetical protein